LQPKNPILSSLEHLQVVQPEDCVIIFVEEYHKSGPQPLAWSLQALAADDIYATAQIQNNADTLLF
jgi:hypothetical protein